MLALAAGCIPILDAGAQAQDQQQLEQQLAEARRKLAQVQRELETSQSGYVRETAALRAVEKDISATRRSMATLADQIAEQGDEISRLEQRANELQSELTTETGRLASLVRRTWIAGRGSGLRTLLSIDELSTAARQLHFQRILAQARSRQLTRLRDGLADLLAVRLEAAGVRERMEKQRGELQLQEQALEASRRKRAGASAALRAAIDRQEQRSQELRADTERLNRLLEELATLFADIPDQLDATSGLPTPAGNLQLPVAGRIAKGAGSAKADGMHRFGMLIEAEPGAPVSAVSYGRVAYADWLRGFGLLTIVDHGDGYLTLYAFNESLYREVGDWVGPGDIIAAAGASGGRTAPALYFELRRNGTPIDPRPWLRRSR
ncbi:MAG: peptidoglycan DD-metalloendopeptidase family protein [Pseudomonadota bacterium]